jgi:SAM-dependent methyltransferase
MTESAPRPDADSASGFNKFAAEFLTRELYRGILEREPSAEELSSCAAAIESTGRVAPFLRSQLISGEFQNRLSEPEASRLVKAAFKGLLGREPDPKGLVAHTAWLSKNRDLASLLKSMIDSPEFDQKILSGLPQGALSKFIDALWSTKSGRVEIEATPEQFDLLFKRIRAEWTKLGDTEPHWSVDTKEKYKSGTFAEHEEEFYQSGAQCVGKIQRIASRSGVDLNPAATFLELGCGTGRMTHVLADMFAKVIAIDVSPGNMRLCQEKLAVAGRTNVEFVLLNSPEDIQRLPPFDFFFSLIVLQHNPPPVIHYFLDQLLGKIRDSGAAYFQVPTHSPGYAFNVQDYLASPAIGMEMHCLPMPTVFSLLAKHRLRPVEVLMDMSTGYPGSHTFFAVRE